MAKETENNGRLEGGVYEIFAYTLKLTTYRNSSDMNELYEMALLKEMEV